MTLAYAQGPDLIGAIVLLAGAIIGGALLNRSTPGALDPDAQHPDELELDR